MAQRARIVLLSAEGCPNREIGELVEMHYNRWRCGARHYALMVCLASPTTPAPDAHRATATTTCCSWSRP